MYKQMYEKIFQAQVIYLYRHVASDYDALGSQFGLAQIIRDCFPSKEVICMGEQNADLARRMQLPIIEQRDFQATTMKTLAIILDTANRDRIDGNGFDQCEDIIKLDHHIVVDRYGQLNIEDPEASSTSELVVRFYLANQTALKLSKQAATWLYYGLVGDTNRFMYESTSAQSMLAASTLLSAGIDKQQIYESMYLKSRQELEVTRYILNHYHYEDGVAYYLLDQDALDSLQINREQGSLYVNTLADIREIEVWAAITYQKETGYYRVSLRSRRVPVEPVAKHYRGGGHRYASGATLQTLTELPQLLQDLKEAVHHELSFLS